MWDEKPALWDFCAQKGKSTQLMALSRPKSLPLGEGAERSEADEGAIRTHAGSQRPLIRHLLRKCHLPPKGKAIFVCARRPVLRPRTGRV